MLQPNIELCIERAIAAAKQSHWKTLESEANLLPYRFDPASRPPTLTTPLSQLCIRLIDEKLVAATIVACTRAGCALRMSEDLGFVQHMIRRFPAETSAAVLLSCGGRWHWHHRQSVFTAADLAIKHGRLEFVRILLAKGILKNRDVFDLVETYANHSNDQILNDLRRDLGVGSL